MPRRPRTQIPGGFYHVITRGNHREALFGASPLDRKVLDTLVQEAVERFGIKVHAFCYMTNHLHFLLQASTDEAQQALPLSKAMQFIKMRYALQRHKRMQTTGHLYEKRFSSFPILSDRHFLAVLKYIHFNPVKAGLVWNPLDYEWSSHAAYLGVKSIPWVIRDFGLSLLGTTEAAALIAYRELMRHLGEELDKELSYLKTKYRASKDKKKSKPKDRLVSQWIVPAGRPSSEVTLPELAQKICLEHSIKVEDLCSPSRKRSLCRIRAKLAGEAIKARIANLAAVAEFLDRDPSALCRLVNKYEPVIDPSIWDADLP